uniref:Uncharacterized protein n=1 Tax=Oryza punctata TaxID=4537 RepID=A0A0E0JRX1_ORYPU
MIHPHYFQKGTKLNSKDSGPRGGLPAQSGRPGIEPVLRLLSLSHPGGQRKPYLVHLCGGDGDILRGAARGRGGRREDLQDQVRVLPRRRQGRRPQAWAKLERFVWEAVWYSSWFLLPIW